MTDLAQYTTRLLGETREELSRADTKASILLAAYGLIVGPVLGGIIANDWNPQDLSRGPEVFWWLGSGLVATALAMLGAVLWPRTSNNAADTPATYFGHVRHFRNDRDGLKEALERGRLGNRDLEQLIRASDIAWAKYQYIRVSLGCAAAGVALCVVVVLTST